MYDRGGKNHLQVVLVVELRSDAFALGELGFRYSRVAVAGDAVATTSTNRGGFGDDAVAIPVFCGIFLGWWEW